MRAFFVVCLILFFSFIPRLVEACESCTIAFIGKKDAPADESDHRWSAKIFYENQNWDEIPASEGHQLHDQNHHTHDKQNEEIIHTLIGLRPTARLGFEVDVPYVTRHFIEIDSHAHLGENQVSLGLGDITLLGDYQFLASKERSVGMIAGIKLPSGGTKELNSFGGLMEPELQPGSGSVDYLAGLTGSLHPWGMNFSASAVYVHKTQGAQDFRFGDVLSVSLFAGKDFELDDQKHFKPGLMLNQQLEKKQNNDTGFIKDSGGYTMLVGPQFSLDVRGVSFELSYLTPVIQELGGVHQELNGIWTGAVGVKFY